MGLPTIKVISATLDVIHIILKTPKKSLKLSKLPKLPKKLSKLLKLVKLPKKL